MFRIRSFLFSFHVKAENGTLQLLTQTTRVTRVTARKVWKRFLQSDVMGVSRAVHFRPRLNGILLSTMPGKLYQLTGWLRPAADD